MAGRAWTKAELSLLRRRYPNTATRELAAKLGRSERATYMQARLLGLRKSKAYLKSTYAANRENGKRARFPKGHVPWNKGMKGWQAGGRSKQTRFKRGHAPHNTVPVGTVVTDADGYLKRKVRADIRPGQSRRNWVYLHVAKWERYRGPVPKGHAVVFKNGDKTDIRIANLECISRQELMRRNTVHRLPKGLAKAVQLIGALNRQINARAT